MLDRTDFDQVVADKLRNINLLVQEAKASKTESILFPFFIPDNRDRHFEGFKGEIIKRLKVEGYHVTNLLPAVTPSFKGIIKHMFIAWSDTEKAQGEAKGYEFR